MTEDVLIWIQMSPYLSGDRNTSLVLRIPSSYSNHRQWWSSKFTPISWWISLLSVMWQHFHQSKYIDKADIFIFLLNLNLLLFVICTHLPQNRQEDVRKRSNLIWCGLGLIVNPIHQLERVAVGLPWSFRGRKTIPYEVGLHTSHIRNAWDVDKMGMFLAHASPLAGVWYMIWRSIPQISPMLLSQEWRKTSTFTEISIITLLFHGLWVILSDNGYVFWLQKPPF